MPKAYEFSEEQVVELEEAQKKNRDEKVGNKLKALLMRARKVSRKAVSEKMDFCEQYITDITAQYHNEGLESIIGNHYKGNHRNMSYEEEDEILQVFEEAAERGEVVEVSEIARAYEEKLGRSVASSKGHIYQVLERHGWRKVMPRSKHPLSASEEEVEASKKLRNE